MRHIIKPLIGALLALLALTALTSTASAATCKKGISEAEHKTLCVEGKQVGTVGSKVTTEAAFTQKTGTTAVLNDAGGGWSVVCAHVKTSGAPAIKSGGEWEVKIENLTFSFSECKAKIGEREEPECEVVSLASHTLSGSLASPETITLAGFTESFGALNIGGSCILNADYTIKGTQGCSLKQAEVEAVAKEFICEPKNSHMNFTEGFGGPVTLKIEGNLELAGTSKGKKYSITK
jgi:hypothetical protein